MTERYVQELEEAVDLLWGWMPAEEVRGMRQTVPDLVKFCQHNHQKVAHDESRVLLGAWTTHREVT